MADKKAATPRSKMADSTHRSNTKPDSQGRSPSTTAHSGMGLRSAVIRSNIRKATPKR